MCFKVKPNALLWAFAPIRYLKNLTIYNYNEEYQVVYWEYVLNVRNSGLMSVLMEADIIICVCNVDQIAASSPLTPQRGCVESVYF